MGGIGNALSHGLQWEDAIRANRPVTVLEDDAVVYQNFLSETARILSGSVLAGTMSNGLITSTPSSPSTFCRASRSALRLPTRLPQSAPTAPWPGLGGSHNVAASRCCRIPTATRTARPTSRPDLRFQQQTTAIRIRKRYHHLVHLGEATPDVQGFAAFG
jgi:GR25 family glycosyltransferase involved in LPS biosynthesis